MQKTGIVLRGKKSNSKKKRGNGLGEKSIAEERPEKKPKPTTQKRLHAT